MPPTETIQMEFVASGRGHALKLRRKSNAASPADNRTGLFFWRCGRRRSRGGEIMSIEAPAEPEPAVAPVPLPSASRAAPAAAAGLVIRAAEPGDWQAV